jgi:hypothetical protein
MSLKGYIPKTQPALWRKTPAGRRQAMIQAKRLDERKRTALIARQTPRKAIRRVSPAKAKRDKIYNARVKVWLKEPGNEFCHCCMARNEAARPNPSSQCHHKFGRLGWLLMAEEYWIPCCSECHPGWIHNHPELAREIGVLAPKGQWNNPQSSPTPQP